MSPQTPMQTAPAAPEHGVIRTLDRIWHREGPLTAADLRDLNAVSQTVNDLYAALDALSMLSATEVEDLENTGAKDPTKATRVVQARQALARFDNVTIERVDPEEINVDRLDDIVDQPQATAVASKP